MGKKETEFVRRLSTGILPVTLHFPPCRIWFVAVCILAFMLAGCGKKLFPVPPGKLRPETIDDLKARVIPQGIELTWSVPVRNMDGSPMVEIKSFDLFREEVPLDQYCQGCPPRFGIPVEIPFDAKPEEARKMLYEDRTVKTGMHYLYAVRTVKGLLNRSDMSNRVGMVWHAPPAKPRQLAAEPVKNGIHLVWQPPLKWTDGLPVDIPLFYRIFRREEKAKKWKKLARTGKTEFFDENSRTDRSYSYRVAASFVFHGTDIQGEFSTVSNVVPRDFIPPEAPKGLVAVQTGSGIELLWQQNSETDMAGYRIYRREPDGLITLLNRTLAREPRFVDREKLPAGQYAYWVTAVDNAQPPNESGMSTMVHIRISGR